MSGQSNSSVSEETPVYDRWSYLLTATPFLVVFLLLPCELFFNQADEWDLELSQLALIPLAGLVSLSILWLLVAALSKCRPRLAAILALLMFALGIHLLLADLYAPLQTDAMEGGALMSDEPLKYTLLELAIGLVVVALLFLLIKGRGKLTAIIFSTLLLLASVVYGGLVLRTLTEKDSDQSARMAGPDTTLGSVYHIVLDRMQTDAFLHVVDRLEARAEFDGFELFVNNVANYVTTHPSRASYLSGTFYHQGDFKDWHTGIWRQQGVQHVLAEQGYRVWNYAPFRQWRDPGVDIFQYSIDIYEEQVGIEGSGLSDFLTLWLLRLAPNGLTNEALPPIEAFRDFVLPHMQEASQANGPDRAKRLTISEGIQVVASKLMFERLLADEANRRGHGEYVYLHAVMPHHPYVFGPACNYHSHGSGASATEDRRKAYLDQSTCSVILILDFLEDLKKFGRYDDATILIHADTGAEEGFLADPPDYRSPSRTLGIADNVFLSGANALLMIKKPGSNGELREIEHATQLVDLYPSLLDILDLETPDNVTIHGRSIYAVEHDERDVRISLDPEERWGDNYLDVRIENPLDLARSALTVVGPTVEPAHWRKEVRQLGE
jgi:hypothetical protein